MGLPVRVVCIDCLQSVEISASGATNEPESCPHCGADLDPYQRGIQSRGDVALDFAIDRGIDSPATIDLSDASTLQSENDVFGGPNRLIGRFQIRLVLGEGGYGQVFRAFDPHLEREVALKVLKPNRLGEKAIQRFYREARAAARLDHPNIVGLHDAGRDDGRCWIAYQLVSGQTLSALRDLKRPSVLESIRIVRDLALGLHHAHGRGVFHRDLKPANVMIDDAGRPRLTDFGLARRNDVDSDLTTEGTVLGTPQYMSPEAAAGRAHEADARSDVYSLGVILYELLCGKRPCDVPSGAPLWRSIHKVTPPTPRSVDRAIPPALDRICMKALALDPNERYASADLLAQALTDQITRFRPARSSIRSIETIARIARPRFRPFGKLAVASTACLVVVAAAMLLIHPHHAAVVPTPPAPVVASGEGPARTARPLPIQPTVAIKPAPPASDEVAETGIGSEVQPLDPIPQPAPRTIPTPADPSASPILFIASSRERGAYHLNPEVTSSCSNSRRIIKRIEFRTKEEAIQAGYKPCQACHPDLYQEPPTPSKD